MLYKLCFSQAAFPVLEEYLLILSNWGVTYAPCSELPEHTEQYLSHNLTASDYLQTYISNNENHLSNTWYKGGNVPILKNKCIGI